MKRSEEPDGVLRVVLTVRFEDDRLVGFVGKPYDRAALASALRALRRSSRLLAAHLDGYELLGPIPSTEGLDEMSRSLSRADPR